ncbi:hypothetical protein N9C39_11780 [Luminiphilus sp.]|nr:hypothetical protein [Luminiphilus sp.]
MDCPISTYSFFERLIECGLYGFSALQILMLMVLGLIGATYALWEHHKQLQAERDEKTDRF